MWHAVPQVAGGNPLQEIIERHNVSVTEDDLYKCFYGNEKSTECDSMKRFGSKYYNYVHYLCNTPMLSQYPTFFNYYTNFLTNVSESLHFNESKKLIVSDDGIRMEKLQSQQQEPFKRIHYGASEGSCKFPAGPQCPSYDAKLRTVSAKNMCHDSEKRVDAACVCADGPDAHPDGGQPNHVQGHVSPRGGRRPVHRCQSNETTTCSTGLFDGAICHGPVLSVQRRRERLYQGG